MNAPEAAASTAHSAIELPALAEGETYVGAIVSACGTYSHHTILLPGDHDDSTWQAAMKWAADLGGDLPNRIEQALLFATLKDQFKQDWYWSNTQHGAYSACAWCQDFDYGRQLSSNTNYTLRARAVRRLPI